MATVYDTTMSPGKVELLTRWLPRQPWYLGTGTPRLQRVGGFRLDDPAGAVGIEFYLATDDSGPDPVVYHVPMTYRGAALSGAENALIGTSEHGVLGMRWIYDGEHDPVLLHTAAALLAGTTVAQHQVSSDTVDPTVRVGQPRTTDPIRVRILRIPQPATDPGPGQVIVPWAQSGSGVVLEAA
ncbi:1,4-alpha-glucan branching protein [Nocardia sp. NPDC051570]|uniref:maltokinase N-terminal cap-like domain-containing protein n=1 Tax=Nocardia sp. NPDC051570 TaxID=3364324 RepID=UPI0037976E6D